MEQPMCIAEALTTAEHTRERIHAVEKATQTTLRLHRMLPQEEPESVAAPEQRQQKNTPVSMKPNRELIKRQREWTFQLMKEIEQDFEETESDKYELIYLKTKTEEQQMDIDRLTAEKLEQYLLVQELRLKIENLIEKLEENKNEDIQEKLQLLKIQAEISQEREILDRRRNEIINEVQRYTETHEAAGPVLERRERQERGTHTSDKVKVKINRIQEEMEKFWDLLEDSELMAVKQESSQTESRKSDFQMHQNREKEMKPGTEKQKQELDSKLQMTTKKRKLEVMHTGTEIKNLIRMNKRKKERISKKKKETEHTKKVNMEERQVKPEGQSSQHTIKLQQMDRTTALTQPLESQFEEDDMEMSTTNKMKTDMQGLSFEMEEIRELLHVVRENIEQMKKIFKS